MIKAGAYPKHISESVYLLGNHYFQAYLVTQVTIAVDRVITEGDKLDLGRGCVLQFSLLPGHSPCSMAAYLPSERVLFASDCGGYPISEDTIFPMYFAGYQDYVNSLQRLSDIEASVLAAPMNCC